MHTLGRIHWGTSGYAYKDWHGPFYPPEIRAGDRLRHYASRFDTVEVNSTYYRVGPSKTYETMRRSVHDDFIFSVKAPGTVTHERSADPKPAVEAFLGAIEPLGDGPVLLQFPFSFRYEPANRRYLAHVLDTFDGHGGRPVIVETRHDSWNRGSVRGGLSERSVSWCCVDLPPLPGLPPASAECTSSPAYVRLHGRNSERWWRHAESWERYDYSYDPSELQPWADRISQLQQQAEHVFVYANNHFRAQAVATLDCLRELHGGDDAVSGG